VPVRTEILDMKNDSLGFTLLPAGVASLFLGIGSFNRDSTALALILIAVGAVLLGIAWRVLKAPGTPTQLSASDLQPKVIAREPVADQREAAE
jgi:hypothetical protein